MREAIAIDFDGCLCVDAYPDIGAPNLAVIAKAKERQAAGAGLILWTCREGKLLEDAVAACAGWGLHFDAVNESLPDWIEAFGTRPRKVGASEYWDDRAVVVRGGAPMTPWKTSVCQRALDTWGKHHQLTVCMEEMAELTKELSKNIRGQDNDLGIAEEVADVEIMLEQLKIIFDIRTDVENVKNEKLIRLDRRIQEANGK